MAPHPYVTTWINADSVDFGYSHMSAPEHALRVHERYLSPEVLDLGRSYAGRLSFGSDDFTINTVGQRGVVAHTEVYYDGWPLPAVWGFLRYDILDGTTSANEVASGFFAGGPLYLPYWSGLLIDVALWSIFMAGLWWGSRLLRCLLRRARGRCTACGYPKHEHAAACSECGTGYVA